MKIKAYKKYLKDSKYRIRRYSFFISILWTIVILLSLWRQISIIEKSKFESARLEALMAFDRDVIYRSWNAQFGGGVYIPVTDNFQPNEYLSSLPERDVVTLSGRKLTLMNPAYMTRTVHELAHSKDGVLGHITSLNPIRPQNKADQWEQEALTKFEQGVEEAASVEFLNGVEYMRFMKPLQTEQNCLKCHSKQGYKVGDIRGGISISIPMKQHNNIATAAIKENYIVHILVWLFGMSIIVFLTIRISVTTKERFKAEADKDVSIEQWQETFNAMVDSVCLIRSDGVLIRCNKATETFLNLSADEIIGKTCWNLIHGTEKPIAECPYIEMKKTKKSSTAVLKIKDKWIEVKVSPIFNEQYELTSAVHIIKDITREKLNNEKIVKNKIQLDNLISNLPGIAYRCVNDREWTMSFLSNECKNLTGYEPSDLINNKVKSYNDLIHPDDREMVWRQVQDSVERDQHYYLKYRIICADGSEKWVWEKGRKIIDGGGKVESLEGFIMDITEQKEAELAIKLHRESLEMEVKKRTKELEQKNADLKQYNKLFIDREFRIKELKIKVKQLEEKLKN